MSRRGDRNGGKSDFRIAFGVGEELAASRAGPVCLVAGKDACGSGRLCLRKLVAESRICDCSCVGDIAAVALGGLCSVAGAGSVIVGNVIRERMAELTYCLFRSRDLRAALGNGAVDYLVVRTARGAGRRNVVFGDCR